MSFVELVIMLCLVHGFPALHFPFPQAPGEANATPANDPRGLLSKQRKASVRVGPDSRPAVTAVRQPEGPEIKVGI